MLVDLYYVAFFLSIEGQVNPPVVSYNKTRIVYVGFALAIGLILFDQLTKYWVTHQLLLPLHKSVFVLPILNLSWVQNTGTAMGIIPNNIGTAWPLIVFISCISFGVAWLITRSTKWIEAWAYGAILGGAVGNLVDRVRLGYVVDFLDFHAGDWHFFVFNIADSAICIGVGLLILRGVNIRSMSNQK